MSEIGSFLNQVGLQLESLRQARTLYAARLAPGFNTIRLFSPNEPQVSSLLADLLSPTGTHGQGGKFLDLFLCDLCGKPDLAQSANDVEVYTEYVLKPSSRRIDIVLQWPERRAVVGIENKPWARDQEDQINDYCKGLSRHRKTWILIYLSADGDDPTSIEAKEWKDLEERGHAKTVSYRELTHWVGRCLSRCESDRVGFFLRELRDYLRSEFSEGLDMQDEGEIVQLSVASDPHLLAALQVGKASKKIKEFLLGKLHRQLEALAGEKGWRVKWEVDYGKKYSTIWVVWPECGKYRPCIEFGETQMRDSHIGICKFILDEEIPEKLCEAEVAKIPDLPRVREALNDALGERTDDRGVWWIWLQQPAEPYDDWKEHDAPWLGMRDDQNPTTAKWVIEQMQAIRTALEEKHLIDELRG